MIKPFDAAENLKAIIASLTNNNPNSGGNNQDKSTNPGTVFKLVNTQSLNQLVSDANTQQVTDQAQKRWKISPFHAHLRGAGELSAADRRTPRQSMRAFSPRPASIRPMTWQRKMQAKAAFSAAATTAESLQNCARMISSGRSASSMDAFKRTVNRADRRELYGWGLQPRKYPNA